MGFLGQHLVFLFWRSPTEAWVNSQMLAFGVLDARHVRRRQDLQMSESNLDTSCLKPKSVQTVCSQFGERSIALETIFWALELLDEAGFRPRLPDI